MSALSDKEKARRRARLEAAVTPQGSGGYAQQREVYRKPITAPSWVYWPAGRKVEQWQVVSLSLGLDPDSLEHRGDFITAESFPDADTQDEFRKRIDLLGALSEEVCAPLSLFVGKLRIFPMPPELAALNLATQVPATIETAAGNVPIVDAGGMAVDSPAIPGKLSPVAIGKLAVTAAWQIECESGRAAIADKIMERLQKWADDGTVPDVLLRSDKKNRAVIWRLKKTGLGKPYDIEACGKTLETWMKSRE